MRDNHTFTLYWSNGDREVVHGPSIAEACTLAGYSSGAIKALDFYQCGDIDKHMWDAMSQRWYLKPEGLNNG